MENSTIKTCLDLFAGLGGFSSAFEDSERWRVVQVDIGDRFDPDIRADVLEVRPSDLPDADVVLASPPCTEFSIAASRYEKIVDGEPQTPEAREAVTLVYHTLGLIHALSPDWWWLENPKGYLRQFIGRPDAHVTFCQYGTDYMKPTDLWGQFPRTWQPRFCTYGRDCHLTNRDGDHGGLGNCDVMPRDPAERAKVPYELSADILEAVESVENTDIPKQTKLPTAATDGGQTHQ